MSSDGHVYLKESSSSAADQADRTTSVEVHDLDQLIRIAENLRSKRDALQKELEIRNTQLRQSSENVDCLARDLQACQNKLASAVNMVLPLRRQIIDLQNQLDANKCRTELFNLMKEIACWKAKYEAMESFLDEDRQQNEKLLSKYEELLAENSSQKVLINKLNKDVSVLKEENVNLQSDSDKWKLMFTTLKQLTESVTTDPSFWNEVVSSAFKGADAKVDETSAEQEAKDSIEEIIKRAAFSPVNNSSTENVSTCDESMPSTLEEIVKPVPESKLADCKEMFSLYDEEGDNKIDATQIGCVVRALGLKPTNAMIAKAAGAEYKRKGEKRLDFEEFLPIYEQLTKEKEVGSYHDYIEGFRVYDKEGNGKIMAAELRHSLLALGERMQSDEIDEILDGVQDAEGMVNYEAFIKKILAGPFPNEED
ncbi:Myosin, essential light chain [Trichinella papuae]|uniref:Myosin, essential light chain n=1 Tax=Trichinella papuae TaxID=268474 RepID=A0A0V1NA64_9BILA|nr:Myosin, essential light chain [Trichinella papuae]